MQSMFVLILLLSSLLVVIGLLLIGVKVLARILVWGERILLVVPLLRGNSKLLVALRLVAVASFLVVIALQVVSSGQFLVA